MKAAQQGFTLLEVLVATVLTIGVLLAIASSVASSIHSSAIADRRMALNDVALSVLSDLRAVSAYDPTMLKSLSNRSAASRLISNNQNSVTVSVFIIPSGTVGQLKATATATQGDVTVSQTQLLSFEAPAPGSTVGQ